MISIALVTPSFNQAEFLEATIRSVLDQEYPALQYVVRDGGSTDGSVEIIRRHAPRLREWTSEKDAGQYDAINRGFARTDAEIMGWLNSDDLHTPWTLAVVGEIFSQFPEIDWLTTRFPLRWDEKGRAVHCADARGFSAAAFAKGEYAPGTPGFFANPIQQESTFWRRRLWEKAGGRLDIEFHSAADLELWARFFRHAELVSVSAPLAGFRKHGRQKTIAARGEYQAQAMAAVRKHHSDFQPSSKTWRPIARDRLPHGLSALAEQFGWLHRAKVCERNAENTAWQIREVFI